MNLRDINWRELLREDDGEEIEEEERAMHEWWISTFGDTSGMSPPNVLTRQGGGSGVYIADVKKQKEFSGIYRDIEILNSKSAAKVISAPRDPSGDNTYVESEGEFFAVTDVVWFDNLVRRTNGFTFDALSNHKVAATFYTDRLYEKVEKRREIDEGVKSTLEAIFDKLKRPKVYEPLDDASLEQIFFNDTELEYEPDKYDLRKVRAAAAIKDYFDFVSDTNYNKDEYEEARGGVGDVAYDPDADIATVQYVSDSFGVMNDAEKADINFMPYDEAMPRILGADGILIMPYRHSKWIDLLSMVFIIRNIRRS